MLHILTNRKNRKPSDISKFIGGAGLVIFTICVKVETYIDGVLQQTKQQCNKFSRLNTVSSIISSESAEIITSESTAIYNDESSGNATIQTSLFTQII